ncbi:MAG: site-specific DNA-methyltransferase [Planctomycetota bacterium]
MVLHDTSLLEEALAARAELGAAAPEVDVRRGFVPLEAGGFRLLPLDPAREARALGAWLRERLLADPGTWDREGWEAAGEAYRALLAELDERLAPRRAEEARLRRAWLRPRLVRRAAWVLSAAHVPEALWPQLYPQARRGWEGAPEAWGPDAEAWLVAHPHAPLDTAELERASAEALLDAQSDLGALAGVLVHGDNFAGLRLLRPRFAGRVQCSYVDPPYNTTSDGFAYPDDLPRGAWLCFMADRLGAARALLRDDAAFFAQIDGHEKERLKLLLDRELHYVGEIVWRIGWISGFKSRAKKFIRNHDTIYHYGHRRRPTFHKHYIPYPVDYVRRDGKRPTGKGYPLEDTWNCSPLDRLDSIQIMSFTKEKVGNGALTQKNENLLLRILESSSLPGEWVLDYFLGSGTTAAVAHKTGRRWLGIEAGHVPFQASLARLKGVVGGDRYGVSRDVGWEGGGGFQVLHVESVEDALARGEDLPEVAGWERSPYDLPASLIALRGVTLERQLAGPGGVASVGRTPEGARWVALWTRGAPDAVRALAARALAGEPGELWVRGDAALDAPGWTRGELQVELERLLAADA